MPPTADQIMKHSVTGVRLVSHGKHLATFANHPFFDGGTDVSTGLFLRGDNDILTALNFLALL